MERQEFLDASRIAILLNVILFGMALAALAGCGYSGSATAAQVPAGLHGSVPCGQQPVIGARIQIYAAGTNGIGSSAPTLLSNPVKSHNEGNFSVPSPFYCPSANSELFVIARWGNPGLTSSTENPELPMMAMLGSCGSLSASTAISVNEVTTVGSVWPLAPPARAQIGLAPPQPGATGSSANGAMHDASTAGSRSQSSADASVLHRTVSILDYGADPTGAADSTRAIQAAIHSLSSSGGTIQFPTGTYMVRPPAASAHAAITLASNVRLEGAGRGSVIKVANGIRGGYSGIFRCLSCNRVVIDNLTIDSNIVNNPIASSNEINAYPRDEIALWDCTSCQVTNNFFENSSSVDAIDFYNGNASVIRGNTFTNFGRDPNHIAHDMSVIYYGHIFSSEEASGAISGNVIKAGAFSDALIAAVTGIETHSSNVRVTGNSVWGFRNGAYITGADSVADSGISVSSNVFDVASDGIGIWSARGNGHTKGYGIDGLSIHGNSIRVRQTATSFAGQDGGVIFVDDLSDNLPIRNVSIANNKIVFDPATSARTAFNSMGIGQYYAAPVSIQNLSIVGNEIDNAPISGIMLGAVTMQNISIKRNTITNASGNSYSGVSSGYKVPIFLYSTVPAAGIAVSRNKIADNNATSPLTYAIHSTFPAGSAGIQYLDNEVSITGRKHSAWIGYFDMDSVSYPLVRMNTQWSWNTSYCFAAGSSVFDQSESKRYVLKAPGHGWQTAPGGDLGEPGTSSGQTARRSIPLN